MESICHILKLTPSFAEKRQNLMEIQPIGLGENPSFTSFKSKFMERTPISSKLIQENNEYNKLLKKRHNMRPTFLTVSSWSFTKNFLEPSWTPNRWDKVEVFRLVKLSHFNGIYGFVAKCNRPKIECRVYLTTQWQEQWFSTQNLKPSHLVPTKSGAVNVVAKEAMDEANTSPNTTNSGTELGGEADGGVEGFGDAKKHAKPLVPATSGAVNVGAKEAPDEDNTSQNTNNGGNKLGGDSEKVDDSVKGVRYTKLCKRPLCSLTGGPMYTIDNDAQLRPISQVEEDYKKPAALTTAVADCLAMHQDGSNVELFGCLKHLGNSPQSLLYRGAEKGTEKGAQTS